MHGVGEVARLEPGAGRVVVEEVGVDVERVDEVELERVHEVDPDELAALDLDRLLHVGERDGVHRVDLVRAVEVGVEAVHDHHELVGGRAAGLRVDHERAVEALGDVLGQRGRVAVVEVQPERRGVELVDGRVARLDVAGADPGHAVHHVAVDAVEVHRVRVAGAVREAHPQPLALAGAQGGAGHAPVVGPGGVLDARAPPRSRGPRRRSPTRARRPVTVPSSKSRRISWGSKPFAAGSTLPTAPRWPEPVVRGAVVRGRGRGGGGGCRGGPWCGISSWSTGAAPAAAAPAEQLAPRNPMLPQLAHWLAIEAYFRHD